MTADSEIIYHKTAHGKLLFTSEYFVLDGALALAIPTKFGQSLHVTKAQSFQWKASKSDNSVWFTNRDTETKESQFLESMFHFIKNEFKEIDANKFNQAFETQLQFPNEWGLGSSSTLIALLSDYFNINPYRLNHAMFKGSGYDIACAFSEKALFYQNIDREAPYVECVEIEKDIKPFLYFIYTEKKQNSRDAISHYNRLNINKVEIARELESLTRELIQKSSYKDWQYLLNIHEELISKTLNLEPIAKNTLKNIPYFSKSLGAWGGDFGLIISDDGYEKTKQKVKESGFETFFSFDEMF